MRSILVIVYHNNLHFGHRFLALAGCQLVRQILYVADELEVPFGHNYIGHNYISHHSDGHNCV